MWSLPPTDSAESLSNRVFSQWQRQVRLVRDGKKSKPSLTIAIARAYGGPYLVAGVLKMTYDSLSFLQPQLLRLLLSFVSSYDTDHPLPAVAGYAISILMFVCANVATAMLHQYFDRCFSTSQLYDFRVILA
jgi:ATP-binding cassette subfamily C (CFTR/MRP) protein 1